jgi:prolyl 4-hydroxylase
MTKSAVFNNKTVERLSSEVRTTTGTFLSKRQAAIISHGIACIEQRVARVTMIPEENQEGMQILHYEDGQNYVPHHDYCYDAFHQDPSKGAQ